MNKGVFITVIIILVIGLVTLGGFYWQESDKLKDAESDKVTMGLGNATLQKVLSGKDAQITTLQVDLTAAQAEISRLEGELAAAK